MRNPDRGDQAGVNEGLGEGAKGEIKEGAFKPAG